MKTIDNIYDNITLSDVYAAAASAEEGHTRQPEVKAFGKNRDANIRMLYESLVDGSYAKHISYTELEKTNSNGKRRHIHRPTFATRVLQHLMLLKLVPLYERKDSMTARNCKKGCGITARERGKSILKEAKRLYYERRDLTTLVYLDQRHSYAHCTEMAFRKGLRCLMRDRKMIRFATDVTYINGKLPIGTPSSPFAHHLIMLPFDLWVKTVAPFAMRYADDVFLACESKADAHQAMWRVKQYWWYELGMRAKGTSRIVPLDVPTDICGYILHRCTSDGKGHGKGYTTVRKSIVRRAKQTRTDRSWASYFGLLRHADMYRVMKEIEKKMKVRQLTQHIRIDRELDAPHIEMRELEGMTLDIVDYVVRTDSKGERNWIKCLVRIPTEDGTQMAREFHGNYQGIIRFLSAVEQRYAKSEFLPLEECRIINQCGYIIEGSTNQIKYF